MIKQILFDCAGVLAQMRFRDLMLKISGSEEIADYLMTHIWQPDSPWLLYDKGELNTSAIKAAMRDYMEPAYRTYVETFVDTWMEGLPPMEDMEQIVDALHEKGYRCYLLSNFSERFQEMPRQIPVLNKLDGTVVSYEIHMLKPDTEIFLHTAKLLGFKPEETIFVDDTAHNVEGAKKAGMESYLFTSPAAFRTYLQERGIL